MSATKNLEMVEPASETAASSQGLYPMQHQARRRRAIRYVTAALSAATAVMYFMIGFRVVSVLDGNADQTWALFAGVAYALGVLLLLTLDHRLLWILGAVLQASVIFTYFDLAAQRVPAFEVWGILIRIAQVMILIALVYLTLRLPPAQASAPGSIHRTR